MDLILWRHAEAELLREGGSDLERALTAKGERQAERMARWLNQRMAATTRVLVSPALRTRLTAVALGRDVRITPTIAPDASADDLLLAAQWPNGPRSREPVLLVGHQPTLGLVAARLLCGQDQPWSVRKGGVWWLRSREREGQVETILVAVQNPDCL